MPSFWFDTCAGRHPIANAVHQVEYLVVVYGKDKREVLLSLRQADILEALASDKTLAAQGGCVPDLQDVPGMR
jgi:glutamate--cysteine ligase catalytic subunit